MVQSTLSGSVDIIVIRQPDGGIKSSPFYVRFGRMNLFKSSRRLVQIYINGQKTELIMKLGSAGEAYFIHESEVSHSLQV